MDENTDRRKRGFVLENKNYYVTRERKIINVEKFKEQCEKAGIEDWMSELKKL